MTRFVTRTDGLPSRPYEPRVSVRLTLAQACAVLAAVERDSVALDVYLVPEERTILKRAHERINEKYRDARRRSIAKQVQAMTVTGEVSPPDGP